MRQIDQVRKAIEIQGYVTINVTTSRGVRQGRVREIRENARKEWVTDIMTEDHMGYVRIAKTKAAVVDQARDIIARETEIRAAREASLDAARNI